MSGKGVFNITGRYNRVLGLSQGEIGWRVGFWVFDWGIGKLCEKRRESRGGHSETKCLG